MKDNFKHFLGHFWITASLTGENILVDLHFDGVLEVFGLDETISYLSWTRFRVKGKRIVLVVRISTPGSDNFRHKATG